MTDTAVESGAYQRDDGLLVIPRDQFASKHFDYKPGHHVVFIGPTQRGKTSLAFKLLEYTANEKLPAYVAVCKPMDPVTAKEGQRLGYRRVSEWPPRARIRDIGAPKPNGYLVWPHLGNLTTDMDHAADVTGTLIDSAYSDGRKGKHSILFMDDTVTKSKVMHLDRHMVTVLTMSGAMGVGGWFFVQKPTNSGETALWAFSQSEHVFICRDPERKNRQRLGEIGGFSTREMDEISQTLKPYQFLYLERSHGYKCIVDAK